MEELQKKHRQEHKDLQSRMIQKKKSATKKTRKGVNDECADLEGQLKEKQQIEIAAFSSASGSNAVDDENANADESEEKCSQEASAAIDNLSKPSSVSSSTHASNGQAKKRNRQKARLARRAAEQETVAEQAQREAADLPNLRDQERKGMREAYASRGFKEHEIRSDGHCLYAAVADQLQDMNLSLNQDRQFNSESPLLGGYKVTRQVAAKYIFDHPHDFVPFLEEPLDKYVETIRDTGEWGGHLEILALAKAYEVDINVLQGDGKVEKIESGLNHDHPELWLAYYRHSFGLGEHYNSLRKAY